MVGPFEPHQFWLRWWGVGRALAGLLRTGVLGVQRKGISPNDFHTLSDIESRLLDFQQH